MPGQKRVASPGASLEEKSLKRVKKAEGLYVQYKGKSIPEPRLPRSKASSAGSFKAVCWNVNGIRALLAKRGKDLKKLVREEKPDLLGFLEHKLQEGQQVEDARERLSELAPEYDLAMARCSKVKKGYSGVMVLLRRGTTTRGAKAEAVKIEKGADEGRTICIELPKIYVVFCYVPNSGDGLVRLKERVEHWDPKLRKYLQGLAKKKTVMLMGDLNVAHRDLDIWNSEAPHVPKSASTTPEERSSFGKLLDAGFVDGFAQMHPDVKGGFSYWSVRAGNRKPNRGLRLDYAILSKKFAQKKGAVADVFHLTGYAPGGDHCPVGATLNGVA